MTIAYVMIVGIRLRKQRVRTTHSVDELIGGGSIYDVRELKTTPRMSLISGVKQGLHHELRRVFANQDLHTFTIALYEKLRVRAEGSDDSLIYHAVRSEGGTPWYDSVLYLVAEAGSDECEEGVEDKVYYCSGRLLIFARIDRNDGNPPLMMALLHPYRCPKLGPGNSHIYDVGDRAAVGVPNVHPLQRMTPAYQRDGKPVFELVDTESISTALWVQQDFDLQNLYWFIRKKPLCEEA